MNLSVYMLISVMLIKTVCAFKIRLGIISKSKRIMTQSGKLSGKDAII